MEVDNEPPEGLESLLVAAVAAGGTETVDPARLQERLRRREAALRAVLEGSPDATVASGRDGRIVFINTHAEALFGYDRDELLGRPVQVLWPSACATATRATWSSTSPRITRCGSRPARTACA